MTNLASHRESRQALLVLASNIVSAYVSRNALTAAELPAFIAETYANVARIATGSVVANVEPPKEPAVSIRKSVTNDHIVCLEDGKKFKSLKRHLAANHGITPQEYRKKWGLPVDYPMVAPSYAAVRSSLAKEVGFGQKADAAKPATKKKSSKS